MLAIFLNIKYLGNNKRVVNMQKDSQYYVLENKYEILIHESLCDYVEFIETSRKEKTKGLSEIKITLYDRFGYRLFTIGKGYGVQKIKNSQEYLVNVDEKGIIVQFTNKESIKNALNALYKSFIFDEEKILVAYGVLSK